MDLTDQQFLRYARHLILPEVDEEGQKKLLDASVVVVGAGGLGSPVLLYLAAAGVGSITVIDDDVVEISNLQRQIIYEDADIGQKKATKSAARISKLAPDVKITAIECRLTAENISGVLLNHQIVVDGSDNFSTRYLVNDAAVIHQKTLVTAAIGRFDGQLMVVKPHITGPCYRCIFPKPPEVGTVPGCVEAGIFGATAGVMGSLQAVEVLKELLGIGESLAGKLLLYDGLSSCFERIELGKNSDCAVCGKHPTIKSLKDVDYSEGKCSLKAEW